MIPKHLKMQNFLSHNVSEIDFDRFDVALVLGSYDSELNQSNGAGKSAIFEAISWVLFGKSRHKKKDGVIKWDKRACRVEFIFWVDSDLFKIVRTRDKIIGESDVTFMQFKDDEFSSIDCDTNTATDKKIVDTINFNYDVFVNSVYFKQDDISMFATTTPSRRKDVLKALLKMHKWDIYQKKAREKAKTIATQIEEKSQHQVPIIKIDEDLLLCKSEILEIKKDIKNKNIEYSNLNQQVIFEKTKYQSLYGNKDELSNKLKEIKRLYKIAKDRIITANEQIEANNKIIEQNSNSISLLQQKNKILTDKVKAKKGINLQELSDKIVGGQTKEKMLSEQIVTLKQDIKLSGNCDLCKTPLTKSQIKEIKTRLNNELKETIEKHKNIVDKLKKAKSLIKQKEELIAAGNKASMEIEKNQIKILKLQSEIDTRLANSSLLNYEKESLESNDYKKTIEELEVQCNEQTKMALKESIASSEEKLSKLKRECDKLNVEYGSKIRKQKELDNLYAEQDKLQKDINKLNSQFVIYDKLRIYFGKEGVQSIIIENIIEELENYANETLAKICNEPTSIAIKTQKQNDNGSWAETLDIIVKSNSRTDDFETFSGGEKFRISLALRLALSNILSKRMGGTIKFLLLDEVSSNLDNKGLEMFINIIKQLGNEMKILVITHNEPLKEKFENIIMVNKSPDGSTVALN